jgi:hypothetical protein
MSAKAKNSKLKALGEKIRLRPGSAAMFFGGDVVGAGDGSRSALVALPDEPQAV